MMPAPPVPTAAKPVNTSTVGCPTASLTADTNVTLNIDPGVILIGALTINYLQTRGKRL